MLKIVAIDLDGCLCVYPDAWVNYINQKTINNFTDLNQVKNKISFAEYKKLKQKYRTSGIKAKLPKITGATKLTKRLKKLGYTIIILTARPIYEIPEVFRDTLSWLKTNKIVYDLLFAASDKHIKILKYFPNINFIVEDNAAVANNIAKLGYKVFLLDNIYNQQKLIKGVKRIKKLSEVKK
ncbi:hypothetical protein LCGC14_2271690 [marine sediment metagenome]|uniref:FCP1 homology domain-containing protein n=1 Tax=marine sediment metagenome TaxID=412755 RepID=A0A0F9FRZ8_9ZZZZ